MTHDPFSSLFVFGSVRGFAHGAWLMGLACFEVAVKNSINARKVGKSERSCMPRKKIGTSEPFSFLFVFVSVRGYAHGSVLVFHGSCVYLSC